MYSQYSNIMEFGNSQPVTIEEEIQQGISLFDDFDNNYNNNESSDISEESADNIIEETEEE